MGGWERILLLHLTVLQLSLAAALGIRMVPPAAPEGAGATLGVGGAAAEGTRSPRHTSSTLAPIRLGAAVVLTKTLQVPTAPLLYRAIASSGIAGKGLPAGSWGTMKVPGVGDGSEGSSAHSTSDESSPGWSGLPLAPLLCVEKAGEKKPEAASLTHSRKNRLTKIPLAQQILCL